MYARVFLASLVAAFFAPTSAAAEVGPAPLVIVDQSELGVVAAPQPAHGTARWHQGVYLRAALGIGFLVDDFSADVGWVDASAHGGSGAFELMIGGSLMDGLVLGGGVLVEQVVDPAVEVENVRVESDVAVGTFAMLGPFVDWYPSPAGGFHLQLLVGGARIDIEDDSGTKSDNTPVGGGLALGVGYEWWLADEWSVGVLGRLSAATLGDDGVTHRVGAASLLASLTFN